MTKQFGNGNLMRLPDGPGWSPDGGDFWVKGDLLYWSDGSIWNMCDGKLIRIGLDVGVPESEWHKYENYSAWSDEKRAEVLAAKKQEREEYEMERNCYIEQQRKLIESAKAKLTGDEYEAVYREGRGY